MDSKQRFALNRLHALAERILVADPEICRGDAYERATALLKLANEIDAAVERVVSGSFPGGERRTQAEILALRAKDLFL